MNEPKILAFSGSTRSESFNQKLIAIAADGARAEGATVTLINLRDFPMPIFNQDLESESGAPPEVLKLKELMLAHDGLLISTPEYNSTLPPVLKNAIDWVSRAAPDSPMLAAFKDKQAGLLSASPSGYGGARSLEQLKTLFGNIKVTVISETYSLAAAHEAFNNDGSLKSVEAQANAAAVGAALARSINLEAV